MKDDDPTTPARQGEEANRSAAEPEPIFGVRPPRGEIVSLSALLTARLLRLKPLHGPRPTGQRVHDSLEIPRWALSLGFLLFVLLFLAMLAFFFVSADAHAASDQSINFDRPTKDWYQGPVRYIITHQEVKAYKSLDSELDRLNFIDWFWQRRDIEPGTPANEFRDRYQQRVYEATRQFGETSKPGWKTDMGKIYILVGPPDEVSKDIVAKSHRGMIFWTYRRPPFPDLASNTVIAFARDKSGEFVISTSPTIDSDVARGLNYVKERQIDITGQTVMPGRRDPAMVQHGVPLHQGPIETMIIAGRMQQLPPMEEEIFKSFATTREFYGAIPADTRFDFYKAGDGSTYTTLTVGISTSSVQYRTIGSKEVPDVLVFGKLVSKDNPALIYPLAGEGNFTESETNQKAEIGDLLVFQATGGLKPGKYQLVLGVQDRVSKKIAAYRRDVEVPDYTGNTLALSSIALAGTMEPTDYLPGAGKPYYLGRFKVIPKPDGVFRKTDELNLYFQVYNPGVEQDSGKPRLEVEYRFRSKSGEGNYTDFGTYAVKASPAQVQGYAVALEKWPEGDYEVAVVVTDAVTGQVTRGTATFKIRG